MKQVWGFLKRRAPELFGIDLRSLALFRVILAAVTVFDLLCRLADVRAFYSDSGVLPRAWLAQTADAWRWSLHMASGEAWFQVLLIAAQALLALMVLIGYRTRIAAVLSFVLLASLQNRNPMILAGADSLRMGLWFWAMFLPLHARWSVDAALSTRAPPAQNLHVSWASAGLLLQVLSAYSFGAILQSGAEAPPTGASGLLLYWLGQIGPLLALSPVLLRPLRFGAMLALMAAHVGLALCAEGGPPPFVALAGLTVLLGGWWWDWAARRTDHGRWIKIYYDRDCAFCLKSCLLLRHLLVLPRCEILPAQDSQRAHALMQAQNSWVVIDADDVAHTKWNAWVALLRHSLLFGWTWRLAALRIWEKPGNTVYDWVGRHRHDIGKIAAALLPEREVRFEAGRAVQRVAAVFVFAVLIWNLGTVRMMPQPVVSALLPAIHLLRLDQAWNVFSPSPSHTDGWFLVPGKLVDGSEVDVLRPGAPLSYARPARISRAEDRSRWRSYRMRLWNPRFADHRLHYARYLCRSWNIAAEPDRRLLSLNLVYMLETAQPPGVPQSIEQHVLWRHQCEGESALGQDPGR